MTWNFDMTKAPFDGLTQVMIAVMGSTKVRRCVYNKPAGRWSGLLAGETPLAFMIVKHPNAGKIELPKGMNL